MFNFFNRAKQGKIASFRIDGMHCTSCGMNIDGEVEEIDGVISAKTSYAKAKMVVEYDPDKVSLDQIKKAIEGLNYGVEESDK